MTTRPLIILGAGRIARALLGQLVERESLLRDRYGLTFPVAAIASSRLLVTGAPALPTATLARIAAEGLVEGAPITATLSNDPGPSLMSLADRGHGVPLLLDLTASDQTVPILCAALDAGFDSVLANKKPLAGDLALFTQLTAHPRGRIGYEATVGAGLPVIAPLRGLIEAGDRLIDLSACLSGTLGYLCTELEDGALLSTIVPSARAQGYTEPDPREDLSGADVRRKALILARTLALPFTLDDVPDAPLVPLDGDDVEGWMAGLVRHDRTLAARAGAASEQGNVLRYIARITPERCEVGLREVPRRSAVGRLRGTDNILTIRTRFYDDRPLTISGPGAGPEVTAAGVFSDLLRLSGAF